MADTTDTTTTPDEQGNKDVEVEGAGNQDQKPNTEKMIPQSEYNKHVGKARTEGREAGKQAALKELEGKRVFTEEEFTAEIKAAQEIALRERDLADVKRAIQAEYGLSEAQLTKLAGDDEKSLRADAELTFGALKKKDAPALRAGTSTPEDDTQAVPVQNKETVDWLQTQLKRLGK